MKLLRNGSGQTGSRLNNMETGLWADILSCWLISFGLLLCMKQLFRFDNPTVFIALRVTVILAVIVLITRRWWLLAGTAGVVAVVLLFLYLLGSWDSFWSYVTGLVSWWSQRFPSRSVFNDSGNIELVHRLITLGICSLVFLLVRRIQTTALITSIVTLILFAIILYNFRRNYWAVFFIAAGILPLMVRNAYIARHRSPVLLMTPPRRAMISGFLICTVLALLARGLVPADTSSWKMMNISELLERFQNKQTQMLEQFSLENSGLQPNASELGGDVSPSDRVVMLVETDVPALMKGMAYADYTGKGWTNGTAADELPFTDSGEEGFRTAFDLDRPRYENGGRPLEAILPLVSARVTLYRGGYTLFTNGRVNRLSLPGGRNPLFTMRGEMLTDGLMPVDQTYTVDSYHLDRTSDTVNTAISLLESAVTEGTYIDGNAVADDRDHYQSVARQYLELPSVLPDIVQSSAEQFRSAGTTNYERMQAMEAWLQSFEYTLTPGSVPDNRDFVEHFLLTQKGYCTYNASAMAVMARVLGVPSRFVVGYGLVGSGTRWEAKSSTAHAWVECYIRGVGWIPFNPTGGGTDAYISPGGSVVTETVPVAPITTTAPSAPQTTRDPTAPTTTRPSGESATTSGATPPSTSGAGQTPEPFTTMPPYAVAILVGVLILLLAAATIVLRFLERRRAYTLPFVRMKYPDPGDAVDYYYTDLLRQLALLGTGARLDETILQHGERIADTLGRTPDGPAAQEPAGDSPAAEGNGPPEANGRKWKKAAPPLDAGCIDDAFRIVMDWRYGRIRPDDETLEQVSRTHKTLEEYLRARLGKVRFFIHRRFLK